MSATTMTETVPVRKIPESARCFYVVAWLVVLACTSWSIWRDTPQLSPRPQQQLAGFSGQQPLNSLTAPGRGVRSKAARALHVTCWQERVGDANYVDSIASAPLHSLTLRHLGVASQARCTSQSRRTGWRAGSTSPSLTTSTPHGAVSVRAAQYITWLHPASALSGSRCSITGFLSLLF